MSPFDGFADADFDAFAQKKWASNAFNLERLEVKLKLTALGRDLSVGMSDVLSRLEMGLTEERPSIFNQHQASDLSLYFYRDAAARKFLGSFLDKAKSIADNVLDPAPHHKHICLAVRIDHQGLIVGLWIHRDAWVDWKNALERCKAYGESDRLGSILGDAPPELRWAHGPALGPDAPAVAEAQPQAVLDGFEAAEPWTIFGLHLSPEQACDAGPLIVGQVDDVFRALLPLYDFIAWSRDNDFHQMKAAIKEHQEKVHRRFSSLDVGDKVRIVGGMASGRIGVVDSIEKRGVVKVRMGLLVMAVKMEDLVQP